MSRSLRAATLDFGGLDGLGVEEADLDLGMGVEERESSSAEETAIIPSLTASRAAPAFLRGFLLVDILECYYRGDTRVSASYIRFAK